MKTIIIQITFLLFTLVTLGQTQLLKNYDFNKGDYYLLGTFVQYPRVDSIKHLEYSLGEFYINDTTILNLIQKEWSFEPGNQNACGHHFHIAICKDGLALENFWINLNCNELMTDDYKYYIFENAKLKILLGKVKKAYSKSYDFSSLDEARNFRNIILNDSSLIMTPTPSWTRFEGEFDFTYKCEEGKKTCFEKEDSIKVLIRNEIRNTYPNEDFELFDRGGSWTEISQTIFCNKSLSDKFNLYYRDTEGYFGNWKPFSLELTTYWINKKE